MIIKKCFLKQRVKIKLENTKYLQYDIKILLMQKHMINTDADI